jgi:hypothetical protein
MTNILVSIWGVIPTNTIAFQQYALGVMLTQATYFAEQWNLEVPRPITTNMVTYFSATPRTNSWDGSLTINNLYGFRIFDRSLVLFRDRRYHANTFVGKDEAADALVRETNYLTLDKGLAVARSALERIGMREYGLDNPTTLKQWKYDSNNVIYPLPLYAIRWESDKGAIIMEVSGISSNVAEFCNATRAKPLEIPLPKNYLALLGLPTNSVFVRSHEIRPPPDLFVVISKPK